MNIFKFLVLSLATITLVSAAGNPVEPKAVSLTGHTGSPPAEVLAMATALLNESMEPGDDMEVTDDDTYQARSCDEDDELPTKEVDGMVVADKGDDPGQYFDGGIAADKQAKRNLRKFDKLDFKYFSNQDWAKFHRSHAENIVVTWPDGHETYGLDVHIEDLKTLFVHAPDTRIKVHPIKIGAGNWTAVHGFMEGTFTEPMPLPDGSFIEPTGMSFNLPMATFGYWQDGVMVQEWLFWDNQTYLRQMGIEP